MHDFLPPSRSRLSRVTWTLALAAAGACSGGPTGSEPPSEVGDGGPSAAVALPAPGFHHIHVNSVDPDPVLAHLESRGVPILEGPYPFGETRAVLIEDLDGMAIELIEAGS